MLFSLLMALCLTWTLQLVRMIKIMNIYLIRNLAYRGQSDFFIIFVEKTLPLEQRRELFRKPARRY